MVRTSVPGFVALLLLCVPLFALGQSADSTNSISEACTGPEYRAFDFWLGQWVVRDSTGKRVGTNWICGLWEEWAGTNGSRGTSLNYYDATEDVWHQDWGGSSGIILHLSGGSTTGGWGWREPGGARMGLCGIASGGVP